MAYRPFEGQLVRLRAREPADEPLAYEFFNDTEVTQYLGIRYPISHRQEREVLDKTVDYMNADFAIETLEDRRYIGGCSLRIVAPELRRAELGIVLGDKTYWDGGYGTDTMRTLCRFGFEEMNLHRIELWVFEENLRAQHVYQKVGFTVEGRLRDAMYKAGHYQDGILMSLLEGELRME